MKFHAKIFSKISQNRYVIKYSTQLCVEQHYHEAVPYKNKPFELSRSLQIRVHLEFMAVMYMPRENIGHKSVFT